ncbi:MAG: ATP-binding cassette domain-containing protein, partial [Usitatibacteraceae bacterium]
MSKEVIVCRGVSKSFRQGEATVHVLKNVDLQVHAGETIAIVGASGTGKSTLLHILGGLDAPTSGEVEVLGQRIDKLSALEQGRLRNRALGFVYQFHHLLPEFS